VNKKIVSSFAVCLLLGFAHSGADDSNDSTPLTCALTEAFECDEAAGCEERTAEGINLPDFFRVDFEAKEFQAVGQGEGPRRTPIRHMETVEGNVLMYGGQEGRAWSMVLNRESGQFSAAIAADGFSFVLFGSCIVD
jgi:hypothetical protein